MEGKIVNHLYEAKSVLAEIIEQYGDVDTRNEAQVRFHIIDRILEDCFNWKGDIEVEKFETDNGFTDYELGKPRRLVVEAKREGIIFEIPAGLTKQHTMPIKSLIISNKEIKEAIEQARLYCSRRGVQLALITNGHQYVAFLASRVDGLDVLEGNALVFDSLQMMHDNFNQAWNCLSKSGVEENRLLRLLTTGDKRLPNKLSAHLDDYPKIRYPSDVQATLKQLSELFIQDLMENPELEESFYKKCYCDSGALNKYALLSKNILEARYAAIFNSNEKQPSVKPANTKKGVNFSSEILAEAMSRRPIVLIGDVGVGKTSFVKNLIHNSAHDEFKSAIYIYIDLGSKATLDTDIKSIVLNEIERQLLDLYSVDLYENSFIHGVYHSEVNRFSKGLWGSYKESNPDKYQEKLIEELHKLVNAKSDHIKHSVEHISKGRKKQVIISIDNADQRDFDIQQEAFIISQELAKEWKATVFLSVRPQTFYKSKRSGALTAYPHKIFTISPPRVDQVVEKRLIFAADLARGRHAFDLPNVKSENLALFLEALIRSLQNNRDLNEFLTNITGGNIRTVIEFVTGFIGSPNVEAEKIIDIMESDGDYRIPLHEFTKQALLGEYSHYSPDRSLSMNVLDIHNSDSKEHFLVPILISYLDNAGEHLDKDGFCRTVSIIEECQSCGFTESQIESALRRSTNKKLIETSLRVTFEEDEDSNLIGDMPDSFRVTTIGAYHIKRWLGEFAYLDAMLFDTPITDDECRNSLMKDLSSFAISVRYERSIIFRNYLRECWRSYPNAPSYFNLEDCLALGENSFERVARAIGKY
jgi:GTPase SAR1 family protein